MDTALDAHFSSLQTINSAGAWAPDSRHFVFPVIQGGKAGLAIFDAVSRVIEQEIKFPAIGEIDRPSWSPDGGSIVFSGLQGGWTHLFVHDLISTPHPYAPPISIRPTSRSWEESP